jgi:splicing factor 3B subunit 3
MRVRDLVRAGLRLKTYLCIDSYDAYIVLSFVNGTLVLSIGETIEEVQDTGFLSSAPTLAVQQLGADALLQVHPGGIRHVLADRRVNEWRAPEGKSIVAATTNRRQVVVALSSAELVYFELDLEGQLNEYQDRKAMGSTVLALSIGEVPEGRQRTPYLVCSAMQRMLLFSTAHQYPIRL